MDSVKSLDLEEKNPRTSVPNKKTIDNELRKKE